MEIQTTFAIIAAFLALPVIVLGTFLLITSATRNDPLCGAILIVTTMGIYGRLGFPLIGIFYKTESSNQKKSNKLPFWIHIVFINILFLIQWLLWSQLIALIINLLRFVLNFQ